MKESSSNILFGIFSKRNDKHIGNIKLGSINSFHSRADLGLIIGDKSFWGKGIAFESICLVRDYAFTQLVLQKLYAGCYESNVGSKKAFLKAGFKVEGFLESHVIVDGRREGCFQLGLAKSELIKP